MTTEPSPRVCRISRRAMLAGTGAAGAVTLTAAGCGAEPKPQDALRGRVVAQTTDVPEGGGLLLIDAKLVITQPEPGKFLAFSASCTHGGCTVQEVTTEILCLCHHSKFGLDGEVLQGPAVDPLEQFEVKVEGTDIILV